ncbi:acyl-CoA N-acyltransferase [Lactarius hatsudake]|nr:acyl-CoA N-acyltransferase [Lactarius hatsudake]
MALASAALPEGLFFDLVSEEEVRSVHALEVQGFPPEEAATIEKLSFRQKNAQELFLGAFVPQTDSGRTLLGYIDGVLSSETTLTSESMSTHEPGARTVLIHGVCVSPNVRRRGIANALLSEYQRRLAAAGSCDRVLLISHEDRASLYERAGFKSRGISSITFAGTPWLELEWVVPVDTIDSQGTSQAEITPRLLAALQNQSAQPPRNGQLFSSIEKGVLYDSQTLNRFDLLCVNERCGSVILKRGVAVFHERESVQLEPAGTSHPDLPGLPSPPEKTQWWLVTPSPMLFENIGFSNPVHLDKPLKLLACAECDLGPVGWCEPGGNEFWVACQRVRYGT